MTADTSLYFNDSCGLEPNYIYNDSPTSSIDSPWTVESLLAECIPIQPIPRTMSSPFSVAEFGPGQEKYFRERAGDTHHNSLNPTAPVQHDPFYPNLSNWQNQQNMWALGSNGQIMPSTYYPSGANYESGLHGQQWPNPNPHYPYMPQHNSVARRQNTNRFNPYPVPNPMSTSTRPPYYSPAISEITMPSPPSGTVAISRQTAVSPQLPEPYIQAQANDAQDLPFRQQQHYFNQATSLPAENWTGPFIPQYIYRPHTNSDRKRYVEEVILATPHYFTMEGPQEYGIPLSDALHSRVKRLVDRDTPVFEGRGPSVSIRLEWPGYRPWTRQIPTKDFRSPPCPITMAKLAKAVAKCVQRFMEENKDRNLDEGTDRKWKVGVRPHEIKLEDVVLVSLHHVSLGSWQPQLRLRRPRV